jgi:hypothetical protein
MNSYEKLILDLVDSGIVILDEELTVFGWNGWLEMVTGVSKKEAMLKKTI